jgi:hypothetical protein
MEVSGELHAPAALYEVKKFFFILRTLSTTLVSKCYVYFKAFLNTFLCVMYPESLISALVVPNTSELNTFGGITSGVETLRGRL